LRILAANFPLAIVNFSKLKLITIFLRHTGCQIILQRRINGSI
jgi:hypothetical protein